MLWTADLAIGVSPLGAAALVIAGAWVTVALRVRAARATGTRPAQQLVHTATLNRVAAAITAITLTSVVIVLAWRLLLQLA